MIDDLLPHKIMDCVFANLTNILKILVVLKFIFLLGMRYAVDLEKNII